MKEEKSTLRKRKGFSMEIGDREYTVYFESYREKTVICYIKEEYFNISNKAYECSTQTFKGIAVCNTQSGDVYDEEVGMGIAFRRAFGDLKDHHSRQLQKTQRFYEQVEYSVPYKFNKLVYKGKLTTKKE